MTKKETYKALLYFYFQDYIYGLPENERNKIVAGGLMGRIKSMLVTVWLACKRNSYARSIGHHSMSKIAGKKWVFIYGKNNYEATKFLSKHDFVFVTDSPRVFEAEDQIHVLPLRFRFIHYLNFLPLAFYLYKSEGKRSLNAFSAIFSSLGWLEAFEGITSCYKPKVIVFSNDHSMIPRAFFWAAKRSKIPTVYIQHASISNYMPPLDFDLSLLEGEDALVKYGAKGIHGSVRLVGMPRFDGFLKQRRTKVSTTIKTVGVAFNTVDSVTKIGEMLVFLLEKFSGVNIILRPHPKDNRNIKSAFQHVTGKIMFSDSRSVSAFEFIDDCDLIIAGDTSIHLEARMLNVHSFYYNLSDRNHTYDLYGYIRNGLVKEFTELEDLASAISKGFSSNAIYMDARYYNAVLGTSQEGIVQELVSKEIQSFLDQCK